MLDKLERAARDLKNGDMNGLKKIYELTSRNVFTFVFPILRDYQLSEDVMQSTYIQIYNKIDSYELDTNFRNWMLTIAKNLALGELKKRSRESQTDDDVMLENLGGYTFNPDYDSPVIKLASEILGEEDFRIVIMYAIGEFKHREIADILNLPLGTVTWKYNQALKKIKKHLDKEGNPLCEPKELKK